MLSPHRSTPRRLLASGLALALSTTAALASANGRFPAAGQIMVDPSDPAHIVVRTTYGVLQSQDSGGTWGWVCEGAIGYGGFEDPSIGVTADGTVLAGIFAGLGISHDKSCSWAFAGGDLAQKYAVDVSVEKQAPASSIVLVSNGITSSTFLTQVFQSADNAQTWTQAGVDLPDKIVGVTLDAAPSSPDVLYVTGRTGQPDYQGFLERSSDRGKTWVERLIPGSDATHPPFLSAIDPHDPDVLYVRLDGDPTDTLLVSHDGGESFETVFTSAGMLLAFALSPDGSKVTVGGPDDGVWQAPTATLAFEQVSDVGATCFSWTSAGLYACASQFKDGFTVGLSTDEGKTFETLMLLADLCGPLECPAGATVTEMCPAQWPPVRDTIGATCGEPDAGAGGAGTGAGDAGSGDPEGGCGVSVAPHAGSAGAALAAFGALLAARARRRRSGRNPGA